MMGGCKNGGHNCGKVECEWGCRDPYGVPTGVVPRVSMTNPYFPPTPGEAVQLAGGLRPGAVMFADPVQQAVDDYLLMERKARAWDALRAQASKGQLDGCSHEGEALAYMDTLMRLDGADR